AAIEFDGRQICRLEFLSGGGIEPGPCDGSASGDSKPCSNSDGATSAESGRSSVVAQAGGRHRRTAHEIQIYRDRFAANHGGNGRSDSVRAGGRSAAGGSKRRNPEGSIYADARSADERKVPDAGRSAECRRFKRARLLLFLSLLSVFVWIWATG